MNTANNYVAIMAGGIGSRFWPASRESMPKQFLDILGVGKSLIQLTYERFLRVCPKENIFIVTNKQYRDLVKEHLPDLTDNQIIGEPSRNNTAPCIAYTAFKLRKLNPEANMVVAPSDAFILNEERFAELVLKGINFTNSNDAIVTLGIQPSSPHTGYGYIQYTHPAAEEIYKVERFTEKPSKDKAEAFLASGQYLWNAGIFIWKAANVLNAFKQHATEIHDILERGNPYYNSPHEQSFIDEQYPLTPSVSVDYAIMEKADNIYTIPSDFGWSDLGSWGALYEENTKDENANVANTSQLYAENVKGCLVRVPKNKLVVLQDLEDYIVVDEGDVLLIYPRANDQGIKQIKKQVETKFGNVFA